MFKWFQRLAKNLSILSRGITGSPSIDEEYAAHMSRILEKQNAAEVRVNQYTAGGTA